MKKVKPQIVPTSGSQTNWLINNPDAFKSLKKIRRPDEIRIVFFGNSVYSTFGAEVIQGSFPFALVITTSDKEVGRKKELIPSPVKTWAQKKQIRVLEVDKLDSSLIEEISKIEPDFLIVEDYGLILPQKLLDLPKFAPLNIHHSLLPKYRGPSPAPGAILAGEKTSGVTIIEMTDEVDAGDILGQIEYNLTPDETTDSLLKKLNQLGGELMVEVLGRYSEIEPKPQDNSKASYTKRMSKQDSYFDIDSPPSFEQLDRMIRAYYPWPTVWTKWKGKIVKLLPNSNPSPFTLHPSPFLIQMEGKKPVQLKDFLNGYPGFPLKF